MSQPSSRLLAATRTRISSSQHTRQCLRSFSQTCIRRDESDSTPSAYTPNRLLQSLSRQRTTQAPQSTGPPRPGAGPGPGSSVSALQRILAQDAVARARNQPTNDQLLQEAANKQEDWGPSTEPFHFHIYSHKHNAHITVTKPNRQAIISMSTGNIGFKKSKRSSYDAAYQLTSYVIDKLHQGNWHNTITSMEVVLRGFGAGREAATKVLLGTEGRMLRNKIIMVSDSTRLKFGGTRSPKARRLG
ncbi:translational machinery component [Annulohypoxylon maeteangense]|uniref:translational machinery component n=1 Tax=Annulohypoxylon maeteangense TaxID=1927788 RepID=UPI002007DF44|nr:translational machinery component [Annulohypoxylon maeteangense]KAI0889368.1 translational machinery component [Annulohypoxylon maeteangense]